MATEPTAAPETPPADDFDVDWPVKLGGREFMVPGYKDWTPQQVVQAGLQQLAKEGPQIGGPNMGPIPLTAEGKVPSAPYITEATQKAGTQESTIPRYLQAGGFGSPSATGRTVLLNAVGLPVIQAGGTLATRVVPEALRYGLPRVGRVLDPLARWIGETGTGLAVGKGIGEATEAPDSDETAIQGGVMGALKQPVTAAVSGFKKYVNPYIRAFTENVRGQLPQSPVSPARPATVPERALQLMEERAGLAPGTLSPPTPRQAALKAQADKQLAEERTRWNQLGQAGRKEGEEAVAATEKAAKLAQEREFGIAKAAEENRRAAQSVRERGVLFKEAEQKEFQAAERQAEIAAEKGRVAAEKALAREQAKNALIAEKADKVKYQAGYEMQQAKAAQAAEQASERLTAQATDDTADLTGRVFGIPKDKVDLHDVLIGVEGKRLAHEGYEKGLIEIEPMLKLGASGKRVVNWLVPDEKTGALKAVERPAAEAFDALSKLGQKSWTFSGTKSNQAAREMYNLQRETIYESMSDEAQQFFTGIQREYASKRGLAGFFGQVAEALNLESHQVNMDALRKGIGKASIWQRFQDRFGEEEAKAVKRIFGIGAVPGGQPPRLTLGPDRTP